MPTPPTITALAYELAERSALCLLESEVVGGQLEYGQRYEVAMPQAEAAEFDKACLFLHGINRIRYEKTLMDEKTPESGFVPFRFHLVDPANPEREINLAPQPYEPDGL